VLFRGKSCSLIAQKCFLYKIEDKITLYLLFSPTSYIMSNSRPRRVIVCLDGTWETPQGNIHIYYMRYGSHYTAEKTNVYKFYKNIDTIADDWEYIADYYSGLGTNGKYPLLGGLFGYGISDQIISAYEFICENYRNTQDEIWLIGFSRGGMNIYNVIHRH
jgi:uncharacterized protein (DUF2235 family)